MHRASFLRNQQWQLYHGEVTSMSWRMHCGYVAMRLQGKGKCVFTVCVSSLPFVHLPCCNLPPFQCRDPTCSFLSTFLSLYPFPCPFHCPCPSFSSTSSTHTRHRRAPHTNPGCRMQQQPTMVLQIHRKSINTLSQAAQLEKRLCNLKSWLFLHS